jgi:hypothetical protein
MPLGLEKLSLKGDQRNSDIYPTEKQENIPPASKEAPPSYAAEDPVNEPTPAELNSAFANLNLPDVPPEFPAPDHCLAHLKLINVFHALKEDIGYTDGLFGLWDAKCEVYDGKDREKLLARTREKRWALYIARAVERFEAWWLNVLFPREGSIRLQGKEMIKENKAFDNFPEYGRVQKWTTAMLPPPGKTIIPPVLLLAYIFRCPHGLACVHAQPSKLSRGLHSIWTQRSLGNWHALVSS